MLKDFVSSLSFLQNAKVPSFLKLQDPSKRNAPLDDADKIYELFCKVAREARIDPEKCLVDIRKTMETLFKSFFKAEGISIIDEKSTQEKVLATLAYELKTRYQNKKENRLDFKRLKELRKKGNKGAHEAESKVTVQDACEATIELYQQLARIFLGRWEDYSIEDLPIGSFDIVEKIKAQSYESVEGGYNYIAKQSGPGTDTYVYIRPFSAKDSKTVFDERDIEVQNFFKDMRSSNYIISGRPIQTIQPCDISYFAYDIRKDTTTLNRIKDISAYNTIDIVSQIAQGLLALSSKKINIHHRGIRPTCIFVNSFDDGYEAKLGCFETAKINVKIPDVAGVKTVMPVMADSQQNNVFVHPELNARDDVSDKEWELGDVYSLSAVLLYCIDHNAILEGTMDISSLYDYYSSDFVDQINDILCSGSLDLVPSMKDFSLLLEQEKMSME